jgi:Amidohydrolase/Bacterial extracellular solute-binding proteins, family 5 Middle
VQWHTGRELNAGDVAWNIKRVSTDPKVAGRGFYNWMSQTLTSIETPDTYTVVLHVAERDGWREKHSAELMPSDLATGFWFDTVNEQHWALRCACDTFGAERIMLGTDWPMLPPEKLKHFVDYIPEALPAEDAQRILEINASRLLALDY